jgi:sec-independent protein translocase protein TatC
MSDESGGPDRESGDDGSSRSEDPASPSTPPEDDPAAGDDPPDDSEDAADGSDGSTAANATDDADAPDDADDEDVADASDDEDAPDDGSDGLTKLSDDGEDPRPDEPARRTDAAVDDEASGLTDHSDDGEDPRPDEPARRENATDPSAADEDRSDVWGTHGFDARSPEEIREDAMGPDPGKLTPDEESEDDADPDPDPDPAPASAAESDLSTGADEPGHGAGLVTPEADAPTTDYDVPDPIAPSEEQQPPDDQEMPLAAHIEEMIKRLAVVIAAVAVATAFAFPFATEVISAMWYGLLPPDTPAPHLYGPLEKILSEIKVASLAGILVALPVLVYESYLFMRPGLYPKERRYYLAAVPTSLILGTIGMAFAYFLILPVLFDYFILYSESGVDKLAFGLQVTFDLIVALLGAFALVFQIPLLIMLAILMGVTTRRWLESRRIYFWAGFLGVGFLMGGADLTGMAPIVIAATMIGLFEGTLALLRWTQRG